MIIDNILFNYATRRQREILIAIREHKTVSRASEVLGVSYQSVSQTLNRVLRKATEHGYVPLEEGDWTGNEDKPKLLYIPDIQAKPGIDMKYIHCIGEYWLAKKPTTVVLAGDFADMPSLSSYDKGKRSYEGARYKNDVEASITAMKILLAPINKFNEEQNIKRLPLYKPNMVLTLGNHEYRISRATDVDPMLYGTISIDDLKYEDFGWTVYPFKKVVVIEGIAFSHFFTNGVMGKACATAQQQLNKKHMSCISGHQQGRQTATGKHADGRLMTSIIAGSAYDYNMDYLGEQDNHHWRGVIMLHNIKDGEFDEVYVPIEYLKEKYGRGVDHIWFCPKEKEKS